MPTEKENFVVECLPGQNEEDEPVLVFVAKRTWKMDLHRGSLTVEGIEEQPPIHGDDVFEEEKDAMTGNLLEDGEMIFWKKKVDVVIQARAYAPGGEPMTEFDVAIEVGPLRKQLRIYGPRVAVYQPPQKETKKETIYRPPLLTESEPITELPLTWDYAYGGKSYIIPPPNPDAEEDEEEKKKKEAEEAEKAEAEEAAEKEAADAEGGGGDDKKDMMDYFTPSRRPKKPKDEGEGDKDEKDEGEEEGEEEEKDPFLTDGTEVLDLAKLEEAEQAKILAEEEEARILAEKEAAEKAAEESGLPPETVDRGTTQEIDLKKIEEEAKKDKDGVVARAPTDGKEAPLLDHEGTRVFRPGEMEESDKAWVDDAMAAKKAEAEAEPEEEPEEESPYDEVSCPFNPIGKGFALYNHPETLDGLELPQIEDPNYPIVGEILAREPGQMLEPEIVPVGFGYIAKSWWLRGRYAGFPPDQVDKVKELLDEQMVDLDPEDPAERAQLEFLLNFEPGVMRPEFHNGAPEDQQLDELKGNEDVVLRNMDPSGTTHFRFPGLVPLVTLDRGDGPEVVRSNIDTVVINRETETVIMLWRGHLPMDDPEELGSYEKFEIDVKETTLEDLHDEIHHIELERASKHRGITQEIDLRKLQAEEDKKKEESPEDDALSPVPGIPATGGAPPPMLTNVDMTQLSGAGGPPAEAVAAVAEAEDELDEAGRRPTLEQLQEEQELPEDVAPMMSGAKMHDLAEDGHERLSDDRWIEEAMREKSADELLTEEDEKEARKKEVQAKKKALRKRLDEMKQKEAEEAAEKAKKKKKKKKKK